MGYGKRFVFWDVMLFIPFKLSLKIEARCSSETAVGLLCASGCLLP
jgi:hypothetical protein